MGQRGRELGCSGGTQREGCPGQMDFMTAFISSFHAMAECRGSSVRESSIRREGTAGEPGGNRAGEGASPTSGFVGKAINVLAGSSHASVLGVGVLVV